MIDREGGGPRAADIIKRGLKPVETVIDRVRRIEIKKRNKLPKKVQLGETGPGGQVHTADLFDTPGQKIRLGQTKGDGALERRTLTRVLIGYGQNENLLIKNGLVIDVGQSAKTGTLTYADVEEGNPPLKENLPHQRITIGKDTTIGETHLPKVTSILIDHQRVEADAALVAGQIPDRLAEVERQLEETVPEYKRILEKVTDTAE